MTTGDTGSGPDEISPEHLQETAGLRGESAGGAGMSEEGAPIGFTAEVGGVAPGMTDDPAEVQQVAPEASERGPLTSAERAEQDEPDGDVPRTG
jgi:hypothetical protein